MAEFIIKYWLEVAFGIVSAAVVKLLTERKAMKEGILAILHDRLFQAGRYHIAQNEITLSELKNVEYLYRSYHTLGGNGTGTEIWERIKDLPLKMEGENI